MVKFTMNMISYTEISSVMKAVVPGVEGVTDGTGDLEIKLQYRLVMSMIPNKSIKVSLS
jgi:hypothetical protein